MNKKHIRVSSALMALILLVSAVGGAAAVTWDNETTETSSTSDATGTLDTITLYPNNSSTYFHAEIDNSSANQSDLRLVLEHPDSNDNSTIAVLGEPTANPATGHFVWNYTHANLSEQMPYGVTGAEYDVAVVNVGDDGDLGTSDDAKNITSEVEFVPDSNTSEYDSAHIVVASTPASDLPYVADTLSVETKEAGFFASTFGSGTNKTISTVTGELDTNASTTTVSIKDNDTQTAFDSAVASDTKKGEWLESQQVYVNGKAVKVYYQEAPSDASGTYAVYDDSTHDLTINSSEDNGEVAYTIVGGQAYSFGTALEHFGVQNAFEAAL